MTFAIHNRNPLKKKMSNFNINRKLKREETVKGT